MRRLRLHLLLGLVAGLVVLGSGAGFASAAGLSPLADCNQHTKLTQHYTVSQLQQALASMPATEREYTGCSEIIQAALSAELGGLHAKGSAKSSSGGTSTGTIVLIVVVILVVLGGGALALLAARRRRGDHDV